MKTRLLILVLFIFSSHQLLTAQVYVDKDATGNNDGTSWTDAYTELYTATTATTAGEIWVADGTYTPDNSARTNVIGIRSGVPVYGGFSGVETILSQRDPELNVTIISGDLNNDDPTTVVYGDPLRDDNSYRLLAMSGPVITIDGFTLTSANANGTTAGTQAGALIALNGTANITFTLVNCTVKDNTSAGFGLINDIDRGHSGSINVFQTKFVNNVGRGAIALYVRASFADNIITNLENCLFANNSAVNTDGTNGDGSLVWIRQDNNSATQNFKVNNCTFSENTFATTSPVLRTDRNPFATLNVNVNNSIFWQNLNSGSEIRAVGNSSGFTAPNILAVRNSLSPLGFTNISNKQNVLNVDPIFTNPSFQDFSIPSSSPARDAGDNQYIINTAALDLAGNVRVNNGTVDMGAYESTVDPCDPFSFAYSNANTFSVQLDWQANTVATIWDVSYYETAQGSSGATAISGLTSPSVSISGLSPNTEYSVFVRGICGGTPGDYLFAGSVTTPKEAIYVAFDATGANDGSSWANAYTNLNNALLNNLSETFWVKAGTYSPGNSRTDSFVLTANQKVYGGFNGTEALITERDVVNNVTTLSGDLNSDDATVFSFTDPMRNDNSYRVVIINGADVKLDGLVIANGNANGPTSTERGGAAIDVVAGGILDVDNCIIERNSTLGGSIRALDPSGIVELNIIRCQIRDNEGDAATIFYGRADGGQLTVRFESSLFYNNKSNNTGVSGGLFWHRQDKNRNQTVDYINCTITNNTTSGNDIITTLLNSSIGGSFDANISNVIFWDNLYANASTADNIQQAGTVVIRNSLANNGFSSNSNKQNILSVDPLFTDSSSNDFTIPNISPAVNFGDNQFVTALNSLDLLGNPRVVDNVDLGAFEVTEADLILNIPDTAFKAALVNNAAINTNADTEIQINEALDYSGTIVVPSLGIASLIGIEAFKNITLLEASNNQIATVDLSNNNLIADVDLSNNQLATIMLPSNGVVTQLNLNTNALASIDLMTNLSITDLDLGNNQLSAIDLLANVAITVLDLSSNNLTELNVIPLLSLTNLDANTNNLISFSISNNGQITDFDVSNNNLEELFIKNGNNTAIANFDATQNSNLNCIEVDDLAYANTNFTNIDSQTSFSINCITQVFVNAQATGANDGSSWSNAYIDLATALLDNPTGEFWIVAGRYVAASGARSITFTVTENQKIYGGFDGTETLREDRDPATNIVIIDGDRDNDDGTVLLDHNASNSLGSDNVYHVITVTGSNVIIDGLTIKGGNANGGTGEDRRGSAIDIKENARSLNVNDVRFNYNRVFDGGIIFGTQSTNTSLPSDYVFTNCVFDRNLGRFATIYYYANPLSTSGVNSTFINCLIFDNRTTFVSVYPNTTEGAPSIKSLFWLRSDLAGGINNGKFINLTISQSVFNSGNTTPAGLISGTRVNGTTNIEVYNSILWNNGGNNIAVDTHGTFAPANTVIIRNSLSQDNFGNQTDKMNVLNSDPNFTNPLTNDFTQLSNSPTIDAGDNQFLPSTITTDLNGNQRIFNTTVDMGAYEYVSTLSTLDFEVALNDTKIYPNPTSETLNILSKIEIKTVEVYNLLGSRIIKTQSNAINVSALENGVYLIKITGSTNQQITKRFIKN